MAPITVRIISRYLLRQHLAPLAFALTALTSLMLLNQVAKQFTNLVGKGLPWSVILEVFVLSIPFIVAVTLPMAVLVAVLYTFSHLAADNEITVMKASGISVGRLLLPVLGGAVVVSLLAFLWSDQVLPRSNHRLRALMVDIQRKKPSFTLREQVINEVVPQRFFLRAARIDQASNRLKDVSIYDLEDPERRRVIRADSGRMAYTPGGADLYLTLFDGDIQEVQRADPTQFNRTFYRENVIRVAGIGNSLVRTITDSYRSDREMSVCQMERSVRQSRAELAAARAAAGAAVDAELRRLAGLIVLPPPLVPDSALPPPSRWCGAWERVLGWLTPATAEAQTPKRRPAAADGAPSSKARSVVASPAPRRATVEEGRVRAARQRAATYLVEIHKKLAIAAACLVFALVGAPVALRFPRAGIGLVIGVSLAVFTVYYVGLIAGEELGDRLIVSPFLAMWTPNLVFTILGALGVLAVAREGGGARGGDWADLKDLLLRMRRRRA
jgi:lipopolysaccharide export system permease protein